MVLRNKSTVFLYPEKIETAVPDPRKKYLNTIEAFEDMGFVCVGDVQLSQNLTKKIFEKGGKRYFHLKSDYLNKNLFLIRLYNLD